MAESVKENLEIDGMEATDEEKNGEKWDEAVAAKIGDKKFEELEGEQDEGELRALSIGLGNELIDMKKSASVNFGDEESITPLANFL